ncbi:histidine kinase N-terminal 7TM domain-containing protein [Algoriphagus sp. D3-2-R+10]|uniref:sensor histidine kinase n=1 Tax=Algoriphagus aurantiacus TaxID=3103948 RepID=UPI002B382313|nr:histidine kinase N-terminal 7TM domain-containing protein [Algoriphagus sp. D3-2-R+10]MEB2776244.1 histidine kinase N-terminal 7TM domain-containing protein [Algoriphagus sp. D3-2-R+10]
MEFILNPFSITLLISGLLVGGLSVYITFTVEGSTRWIALTMLCAAIWGFFYGLELSVSTLEAMKLFIKLEYLGIAFIGAFWVIFSLKYTSYKSKNYRVLIAFVLATPILTYLLVLTNEHHHLYYQSFNISKLGPFPTASIEIGPWYYVNLIYTYAAFAMGLLIIWKRFRFSDQLFKTQTQLMLLAVLFPLLFNLFYQSGIFRPFEDIDLTPFSFLLSYLILGFAIIKYQLFNLKPIARNKVMEAITRGVLVLDSETKIVDFNPAFLALGIFPEKVKIATKAEKIFENKTDILKLIASGEANSIERNFTIGDTEKIFQIETIPLQDRNSVSNGLVLLFADITEQKSINEKLKKQAIELQQLNDLKDKYFSIISHDLKGPIFGIKELIHLTNSGDVSNEEFLDMLPEVSRNMEQVAHLLENLLAWSSSQLKGGEIVKSQDFDIHKTLVQQKGVLERIANEKKIEILIDARAKSNILADKNMIELVMRNLISNAIKFSNQGEKIRISTDDEEDFVKICIEDYGKGISTENLSKIYEGISFTTTGQNNESGTGLGLVLVKEYIQKNNGQMEVYSEEGKRTKFCIRLPAAHRDSTLS